MKTRGRKGVLDSKYIRHNWSTQQPTFSIYSVEVGAKFCHQRMLQYVFHWVLKRVTVSNDMNFVVIKSVLMLHRVKSSDCSSGYFNCNAHMSTNSSRTYVSLYCSPCSSSNISNNLIHLNCLSVSSRSSTVKRYMPLPASVIVLEAAKLHEAVYQSIRQFC